MDAQENLPVDCPLDALPDTILLHSILPLLDFSSLGRLACCSLRFSKAAVVDHLWFPICCRFDWRLTQRDWLKLMLGTCKGPIVQPPPEPWHSWHQLFCFKQNRRCIECGEHTPYVYTLSSSRFPLCERCEYACPKYVLITELEAKARYLLTDEDLRGLPYKKVCHKRFCVYFFLKTDVELVAFGRGAKMGHDSRNHEKIIETDIHKDKLLSHIEGQLDEQSCSQTVTNVEPNNSIVLNAVKDVQLQAEGLCISELSERPLSNDDAFAISQDSIQGDVQYGSESTLGGDDGERICKKEQRKEHKRQVKAAQREKRMFGSTGISGSQDKNRGDSQKVDGKKVSKVGNTGLVDQNIQRGSGAVQTLVELPGLKKDLKKNKWRTKREHTTAVSPYGQTETMECNVKWKTKSPSVWVREREWLEVELGPYGLSALELAPQLLN